MATNWQKIWQNKTINSTHASVLSRLIAVDGFDAFGGVGEEGWIIHTQSMGTKMGVEPDSSIYEMGCGAGAFLYPFYAKGHQLGGCDFAENLIQIAHNAMPDAALSVGEGGELDTREPYDVVLSHGVFLYFPDYDYAAKALMKMLQKSKKSVAVLDVPDLTRKEAALQFRRGHMGEEDYNRRYAGLDHLYYAREWFAEILAGHDVEIKIEDQAIPGYPHNSYRYNVFITKRS